MLKIKNQKRDPFVPLLTISALFNLSSFRHWNQVVINQKEFDFTRKELRADRKIMAKALLALGVKKGDICEERRFDFPRETVKIEFYDFVD